MQAEKEIADLRAVLDDLAAKVEDLEAAVKEKEATRKALRDAFSQVAGMLFQILLSEQGSCTRSIRSRPLMMAFVLSC